MQQITVLIADDDTLLREGLHLLLAQYKDIQVVGEAVDGLQALSMAEALQPDILLLDVSMPEASGLQILPKIRARSPRTKVLMLSGFSGDTFVAEALQHGARGYLLKTATHKDLVKAIRVTHAGDIWAERKLLAQALEGVLQRAADGQLPLAVTWENLTDREYEIVRWAVQGMTNKEIAMKLGISHKTVKTHLTNVFGKLNVTRRGQLVQYWSEGHMN